MIYCVWGWGGGEAARLGTTGGGGRRLAHCSLAILAMMQSPEPGGMEEDWQRWFMGTGKGGGGGSSSSSLVSSLLTPFVVPRHKTTSWAVLDCVYRCSSSRSPPYRNQFVEPTSIVYIKLYLNWLKKSGALVNGDTYWTARDVDTGRRSHTIRLNKVVNLVRWSIRYVHWFISMTIELIPLPRQIEFQQLVCLVWLSLACTSKGTYKSPFQVV